MHAQLPRLARTQRRKSPSALSPQPPQDISRPWHAQGWAPLTGGPRLGAGSFREPMVSLRAQQPASAATVAGQHHPVRPYRCWVLAAAPSVSWLIASRGVEALGAALMASNLPAILTGVFPESRRGQVLGLQGMAVYIGLLIGPSLGEVLTTGFGWRAVFLINLPVGL